MNPTLAKYTLIFLLIGHVFAYGVALYDVLISSDSPFIEMVCGNFGDAEEEKSEKSEKEVDDKCFQEIFSLTKCLSKTNINIEHSFFHYSEAHPQMSTPPPELIS